MVPAAPIAILARGANPADVVGRDMDDQPVFGLDAAFFLHGVLRGKDNRLRLGEREVVGVTASGGAVFKVEKWYEKVMKDMLKGAELLGVDEQGRPVAAGHAPPQGIIGQDADGRAVYGDAAAA